MITITYTIATGLLVIEEEPFQHENMVTTLILDYSGTDYEDWTKYVKIQMASDGVGIVSDPLGVTAVVEYDILENLLTDGYIKVQPFATDGEAVKQFDIKSFKVKPSLNITPYTPSMGDDAFWALQIQVNDLKDRLEALEALVP